MRRESYSGECNPPERAFCKCGGLLDFKTDGPFGIGQTIEFCPKCESRKRLGLSPIVVVVQPRPSRPMKGMEWVTGPKCIEDTCDRLTVWKGGRRPERCPQCAAEKQKMGARAWNKEHAAREKAQREKQRRVA